MSFEKLLINYQISSFSEIRKHNKKPKFVQKGTEVAPKQNILCNNYSESFSIKMNQPFIS